MSSLETERYFEMFLTALNSCQPEYEIVLEKISEDLFPLGIEGRGFFYSSYEELEDSEKNLRNFLKFNYLSLDKIKKIENAIQLNISDEDFAAVAESYASIWRRFTRHGWIAVLFINGILAFGFSIESKENALQRAQLQHSINTR